MRIQSIDAFRVVAVLAVIGIHTGPFSTTAFFDGLDHHLMLLFKQGGRFAVPFFFLAAGYFLGRKLNAHPDAAGPVLIGYARRLLEIWLFWNLVYIFSTMSADTIAQEGMLKAMYWRVSTYFSRSSWEDMLFVGSGTALWFVVALLTSVGILGLFHARGAKKELLILSVGLYAVGLLGGSYAATPLGLDLGFNTRNGPFFGTLFVTSGYLWASHSPRIPMSVALPGILAGVVLMAVEILFLSRVYAVPAASHEYLLGTLPVAFGIFATLLARPRTVGLFWLPRAGRFTLGVYVAHPLVNWTLWPMRSAVDHPLWEVSYPLLVYGVALGLVYLASRIPHLRRFVV
jgi:surface polysaccharide O-acyltransferase-like enzyme